MYTLVETGTNSNGNFTETVTGTDSPTLIESGNSANQTYNRTITDSDVYTETDSGAGATLSASTSGTISSTLSETSDARAGMLSQSETGSDRYSLLQNFVNVANTTNGNQPGNMDYLTFGEPFVDPSADQIWAGIRLGGLQLVPFGNVVRAYVDPNGLVQDLDLVTGGGASRALSGPYSASGGISGGATGAAGGAAGGAMMGAVVVPVIGAVPGALIGAGAGAIAGLLVGGYTSPLVVQAVGGDPNSPLQNAAAGGVTGGYAGTVAGTVTVIMVGLTAEWLTAGTGRILAEGEMENPAPPPDIDGPVGGRQLPPPFGPL